MTPGDLLGRLGVPFEQVTDPGFGYSGDFTPRAAFGHWTASAAGSDASSDVLHGRCYHACVSRAGVVKLGGWQVRQGHGGEGRSAPMRLAVGGQMTLEQLQAWQADGRADDTASLPNQYGYGVCLDNDGLGEPVPAGQWGAWCSAMAVFVVMAGGSTVGSVIDHSASTNRKVDLSGSPAIDVARWWSDISARIDVLMGRGPHSRRFRMFQLWREVPDGHLYVSDGMNVRWMAEPWDFDNVRSQMTIHGYDTTVHETTQSNVESGMHGVLQGRMPPW